jgi:hypothetical protein
MRGRELVLRRGLKSEFANMRRGRVRVQAVFGVILAVPLWGAAPAFAQTRLEALNALPVHWQGSAPCQSALELDMQAMPLGSPRQPDLDWDPDLHVYEHASGVRIQIKPRSVKLNPVYGPTFADAALDVLTRRPLQMTGSNAWDRNVRLASIRPGMGMSHRPKATVIKGKRRGWGKGREPDQTTYSISPNSFRVRFNPRISILNWADYDQASPEDQARWDRLICGHIHHEIGHLLVAAQLVEEHIPDLLPLSSDDKDELSELTSVWFKTLGEAIAARQDAYHDEIARMGPVIAESRPYLELDFPWLTAQENDLGMTEETLSPLVPQDTQP